MSRSRLISALLVTGAVVASCNLDTTPPNELPHFPPAWKLVSIDGQALPDTLALTLENSPPGTEHKIEAGTLEFVFPRGTRVLRWTFRMVRLTDALRFLFSFDANYLQFGADSITFPTSRTIAPEFFGGKRGDTLMIVTVWSGDSTTPAIFVGGSHTWRFQRDTAIK